MLLLVLVLSKTILSQPVINSVSPNAASIGASVIISGNNFSTVLTDNVVLFGATRGVVSAATTNSITVTVPVGATYSRITVITNKQVAHSPLPFNVISGSQLTPNSFTTRVTFNAGSGPSFIARGDLDGDGLADMAVSNFSSSSISVYRNTSTVGTVAFDQPWERPTAVEPEGIVFDDVDGDGRVDILVTSISNHMFSVFLNYSVPGSLSLSNRMDFPLGGAYWPRGIATGDLDGDGKTDIITADNNKIIDATGSHGTLSIYRNTGNGTTVSFVRDQVVNTGDYPRSVAIGDLDGDKKPDVAAGSNIADNLSVFRNTSTTGAISLVLQQTVSLFNHAEQVRMADMDGDGKTDVLVSRSISSPGISILRNSSTAGNIAFATSGSANVNLGGPFGFSAGDMDGDGKPELAAVDFGNGVIAVSVNSGNPGTIAFNLKLSFACGNNPVDVLIGDVDGDRLPDLTLSNASENKVSVLRMNGIAPTLELGKDTAFCAGDSLLLSAANTSGQYLWSTGETTGSIIIKQTGKYWVQVTTPLTVLSDTINITVHPAPVVELGNDTTICTKTSITLDAFNNGAYYAWSNGATTSSITVSQTGVYRVNVLLNGCVKQDTIAVAFKPSPEFTLGRDAVLCSGESIVLDPGVDSVTYLWQDGSVNKTYTVNKGGLYSLTVKNSCGTFYDEILITEVTNCDLFMPNAFTPNNDGKNDVFRVKYPQFFSRFELKVFNRWGQVIYATTNPNEGWDGTFKRLEQPVGNYVWTVSLTTVSGKQKFYKGYVLLIR